MKVLVFGDIHFRLYSELSCWSKPDEFGVTEELRRCLETCKFVASVITERQPDKVIFLGDAFHNFDKLDIPVIIAAKEGFSIINSVCKDNFYLIPGNHDVYRKGLYSSAYLPCSNFVTDIHEEIWDGKKVALVAYFDPEKEHNQKVKEILEKNEVVFAHCSVPGFFMSQKYAAKEGVEVSAQSYLVSGHFHLYQEGRNVFYPGAVKQVKPHEYSEFNGCVLIDLGTMEKELIPSPLKKIKFLTDENYGELWELDPNRFAVKVRVSEEVFSEIEKDIKEFESQVIVLKRQKKGESETCYFSFENPETVIQTIIENEYKHLKKVYKEIAG